VYKVFNELQSFWALGSETLKKFINRSKQILHKQKSYVYAKRGKELPQEPEPTQQELEEIWAELVSKTAKKPSIYKNFLLNQLSNKDSMTVANFNT
jgi:hypothetical protein